MRRTGCTRVGWAARVMSMADRRLVLWKRIANLPFIGLILLYRATLSHLIGGQCRYEPTCSRYGLDAYRAYGPVRGTRLTIGRIMRCHPFVKGGYDPVPIPDGEEHVQMNQDEKGASHR